MENFLPDLRKKTNYSTIKTGIIEPFFCIDFNENGAFVKIVNSKLQEIEVDYMNYNGEVFNTLRTLNNIRNQKQFIINWEGSEDYIYLPDHDYLIYLLMRCPNLINSRGEKIYTETEPGVLVLKITEEKNQYRTQFFFRHRQQEITCFQYLTDSFVLVDNRIYPIESIGEEYKQADVFVTSFSPADLDTYLSVLYSHLRGIQLDYKDYKIKISPEPVSTLPVLIFEKIDPDKSLFMRVSKKLPNIEHEIIEEFELTIHAQSNDIDHTITLRTIIHDPLEPHIDKLNKLLAKNSPTKELRKEIYQDNNLFIIPEKIANSFIVNELPALLSWYTIYGAEKLHEYHIRQIQPQLDAMLASDINFLEGEVMLCFDEEKIPLFEALRQFDLQNYVLLADGTRAIVNQTYMQQIAQVFHKENDKKSRLSFFDIPLIEEFLSQEMQVSSFEELRDIYKGFNTIDSIPFQLPPVKAKLRDYQLKGVKWLNYLYQHTLGGCLADDMGLGKTLQTITLLAKIYVKSKELEPTLIIMPKSLLYNWQSEIKKFAPQLTVATHKEGNLSLKNHHAQIILTTYGIVRNNPEEFINASFHYIILDESQNIKNRNSQITKIILKLKAKHRLALSGTPIENNLTELYSLFCFLNPGMFSSYDNFAQLYVYPIQHANDKGVIISLKKKIYPFIMRRLKKDVLTELPDRIEQTLYVEMGKEQQALYNARRLHYYEHIKNRIASEGVQNTQIVLFQALTELRRIASVPEIMTDGNVTSSKIDLLTEYLIDAVSNNHKVIVFFNYISGIEYTSERLNEENIDFVTMTGSTRNRQAVIEHFQKDENCKVFLMTLKTGGVGLNLTAADTVFIFEPWWNRAAEEQAISRIHRIGQTKKVISYSLITRGSIEEKIQLLQQQKTALFSSLIENDSASLKNLSESDIDYILG